MHFGWKYLAGGHSWIRSGAQSDYLPQEDSKAPHVGFGWENVIVQTLWRHPADGKSAFWFALVDVVAHDVTGESEIGHFAHPILRDQHVPGGQITVNDL